MFEWDTSCVDFMDVIVGDIAVFTDRQLVAPFKQVYPAYYSGLSPNISRASPSVYTEPIHRQ